MQMTKTQSLRDELGSALLLCSSIFIFIIVIIRSQFPADGTNKRFYLFIYFLKILF